MKNVVYYSSLTILWIIFLIVSGEILIAADGIQGSFPTHYYALAVAVLQPRLWFISAGLAMLFRPYVYKLSFGLNKSFNKSIAIFLIILGAIGIALNIGADYIIKKDVYNAKGSAVEHNYKTEEKEEEDVAFAKVKRDIEEQCISLCKDINSQLPIRIDELTTLNSVLFGNWNISFHYYVEIDINDYHESDIKDFMREIKASQKQQISNMFIKDDYDFTREDFREFCKRTGLKFRFVYFDINNTMIGANVFDYRDF